MDGGVHTAAGMRLFLGQANRISRLSAFSRQAQEHLPPVDTVDAALKTISGATGSLSISFGTTMKGSEYAFGCENGSVSVKGQTITVVEGEHEETKEVEDERSGVPPEVRKWAEGIVAGKQNPRQRPEEGLADLEIVSVIASYRGNTIEH